jgi:quinol monooxygenase YgiN
VIIGRFSVQCRPERAEEMAAALLAVEVASRRLPGVVQFDCARSLSDAHTFVVTEVFDDRAALDVQDAQPEVTAVLGLVDGGALVRDFEWTVWEATHA